MLPPTVTGYYLLVLFGRRGWLGGWLQSHGIELVFTWQGAVVAAAVVAFPMVLKAARAAFLDVDHRLEQAAAVPVAAITALQALRDSGQLQAGEKVLINGASGGVGTYAVQIAKSMGAEVHGVNSTRNVKLVLGLGADHVFDYKKENYTDSDERYDLILDMVGNHSLLDNSKVMKPTGRLVQVGGPSGDWVGPFRGAIEALLVAPFMEQEVVSILAQLTGDDLAILATLMSEGKMTSQIDQSFPLVDTAQAIAYSETGRARGKIIVGVD